ncbi:DUF7768 domain-containing protein [Cryobacterium zhongshanensis]|uniref:DUF7768 domain-containing protein n=1 Tax=Cryobacterium zhongshanensis TaxID=2928153 RepID=A0AA41UHA4_9MICO|nr:hypothetical protein [Cryobacterium zhongshanensis]MCI4659705.1 hypothetical protein [Cryobacterium zhongshanensis]
MSNVTFISAPARESAATATDLAAVKARHPSFKTKVIIESPLASPSKSGLGLNQLYGRAALRDSLLRGEAPMASHMLYAQKFVLDDTDELEREIGMVAGFAWLALVDRVVVYVDRGISNGMREGIRRAEELNVIVEERSIPGWERG